MSQPFDRSLRVKTFVKFFKNLRSNPPLHLVRLVEDKLAFGSLVVLFIFIVLAAVGPYIAPHSPLRDLVIIDGSVQRLAGPSLDAPFGTTRRGQDVFSQFLAGARPTLIAGILGGTLAGFLGSVIGVISGYYGGWVDGFIMRTVDLFYAIPGLPLAMILLLFLPNNIFMISFVLLIGLWKTPARVVRSEVLTVRERMYVESARSIGAGHPHTMIKHVAPNILPIGVLYIAYSTAWAISAHAALAFIGFGDPTRTSWARMLEVAFQSGALREAWWWVIPPALGIASVTVAVFLIGRAYEEVINPKLDS